MRRRILILAALAAAAAALSLVEMASGQASPPTAGVPVVPQPTPAQGSTDASRSWSHPGAYQPFLPPSPYDGAGRPGTVSYRYDTLGRIVEIVRIPAR